MRHLVILSLVSMFCAGCGLMAPTATPTLAGAVLTRAATAQLRQAAKENHDNLESALALREARAISAFVERIRSDPNDPNALDAATSAYVTALAKIRGDRDAVGKRYVTELENLQVIDETQDDMVELVKRQTSLQDEARRLFGNWEELITKYAAAKAKATAAEDAEQQSACQQTAREILERVSKVAGVPLPSASPSQ